MYEDRIRNEVVRLLKLKSLLNSDKVLPLRFDAERMSLDLRHWRLLIWGIRSPISASITAERFNVSLQIPEGYPWQAIPYFEFEGTIPFHPHIYPGGKICWGSGNTANPDLTLVDWFRGLIEYLQHNQDHGSLYRMDPGSAANREALGWWQGHRSRISEYVPPIDMARLRFWIDQCHG